MVFCFVQKIFFGQHKSQNIYLFCRAKREIFSQNLPLGYMTKTLNHIIFFFLHQNQNIFSSNNGNQNIFLEKNHNPPFKLNGRSLTEITIKIIESMYEYVVFLELAFHVNTSYINVECTNYLTQVQLNIKIIWDTSY